MKKSIRFILLTLIFILCISCISTAFAASSSSANHIIDYANMLSASEYDNLKQKLEKISSARSFDVVVAIVPSIDCSTAEDQAIYMYEKNGFNSDGIILFIATQSREYWIQPFGSGLDKFDDYKLRNIEDEIVYKLSDKDYYGAADTFADIIDDSLKFPWSDYLLTSLVIGIILAAITLSRMKAKLKTVQAQTTADTYAKENSLIITNSRDFYLYRTLRRTPIPRNNGSSGHRSGGSSSRGSHGGRGGKF